MARAAPRPVVHRVAPQPPGLGASAPRIEHRQRGVVREQLGRRQHGVQHQLVQRRQPPAGAPDPVAQGRAIQRDPLAAEDLRLAIQRQMVAVLVDQDMRQQCLGRHAAVDWPLAGGCLHDRRLAGATAIARPTGHADPEVGGDIVQHLRAVFADQVQTPPQQRQTLFLTSITCSTRGSSAGSAPRLRLAGSVRGMRGAVVVFGGAARDAAASSAADCSATDCSRSSAPCCRWRPESA